MKKSDIKALHSESVESLKTKLAEVRKSQFSIYSKKLKNEEKNVHIMRDAKKDIARILSVLRNKELGL